MEVRVEWQVKSRTKNRSENKNRKVLLSAKTQGPTLAISRLLSVTTQVPTLDFADRVRNGRKSRMASQE